MQDQYLTKEKVKKLLPKLKCAFHQNQSLTNFCSSKKCLLPLCPSCIKIHTLEHVNMKTDPEYQNLMDVILNLNMQIKDFVQSYEDNHRLFAQVEQKVYEFKEQISSNIQNLKKSIVDQVQKYFDALAQSTELKISQMRYIKQLAEHKNQLKKSILILKRFIKNMSEENVSGKFVIRNLIKYSANNIQEGLDDFDCFCKQFISQLQGNFCTFSLRENLKSSIDMFLSQVYKINIHEIPVITNEETSQKILKLSKKLQQFNAQAKPSQKGEIKNSLSKVMSKVNGGIFSSDKKISAQRQLNQTISFQKTSSDKENQNKQEMSRTIFEPNNKRSYPNHLSQRKSLNISNSICSNENSFLQIDSKSGDFNFRYPIHQNQRRRSSSKGKGLSLIQPNYRVCLQDSRGDKPSIRFSLSSLQNINLDLTSSKNSHIHMRR